MHETRTQPSTSRPSWTVREVESVSSTNDAVADWAPWTALRAVRQTGGRGRHQRAWVSDAGGLWLSAVVPMGPPEQGWAALPLAAGLAVCETLSGLGVRGIRLRWPNDVMVGSRKLAGLLVDCFRPGSAVVGMGVNVFNHPDREDPLLAGTTVRLADLVAAPPGLPELTAALLDGVGRVVGVMERDGFGALGAALDRWWIPGLRVEIEVEADGARWAGVFEGVDAEGRLRVRGDDGFLRQYGAHQVTRLRETQGIPST